MIRTARVLLPALLACSVPALCAAADAPAPAAEKTFLDTADKLLVRHSKALAGNERAFLDKHLAPLKGAESSKAAAELTSTAASLSAAGYSPDLGVALAAAAAKAQPRSSLAANNLGALLRLSRKLDDSLVVLGYARTLEPVDSPLVLTNLGSSLFELGRDKDAEKLFRQVLEAEPRFALARQGLVALLLKRGDAKGALAELFKAAETAFTPSLRSATGKARESGAKAPGDYGAASGSSARRAPLPPGDRLVLPDLPRWEGRLAFVAAAPGLQAMCADVVKGGLQEGLMFGLQYHADKMAEGLAGLGAPPGGSGKPRPDPVQVARGGEAPLASGVPSHPLSNKALFELELLHYWLADRVEPETKRMNARREAMTAKFDKAIEDLRAVYEPKIEAASLTGDPQKVAEVTLACSKQGRLAADEAFEAWRDSTLELYSKLKPLLEEYWVYSDALLGRIPDRKGFEYAQKARQITVKGLLLPMAMDFAMLPMAWALGEVVCAAPADGRLPDPPPAAPTLRVPEKAKPRCEIEGRKLKFGVGAISFSVECDSWELEGGELVKGAFKRNFKTGESTIFIGVGVEAGVDAGAARLGAGWKEGWTATFDGEGRLQDLGSLGEKELGASVGGAGTGVSESSSIGIVAPVRVETTRVTSFTGG